MDEDGKMTEGVERDWTRKEIAKEAGVSPDLLRHYERSLANFIHPLREAGKPLRYDEVDARLLLEAVRLKTRRGYSMKQVFAHFNGTTGSDELDGDCNASSDRLARCLERLEAIEGQGAETDRKVEILAEAATKLLAQNQALFALCREMQGVIRSIDGRVDDVDRRLVEDDARREEEKSLGFFARIKRRFLPSAEAKSAAAKNENLPVARRREFALPQEESFAASAPTASISPAAPSSAARASAARASAAPSPAAPSPASPSPGFGDYFRRFSDASRKVHGDAPWFLDFLGPMAKLGRQREEAARP